MDFKASQSLPSIEYEPVDYEKNPLRGRLRVLKRDLVAEMLAQRGSWWDAIREVRDHWRLDPVPTQLPPDSMRELEEISGVSYNTIWRLENGLTVAQPRTIRRLAEVLGVEAHELIKEDGDV